MPWIDLPVVDPQHFLSSRKIPLRVVPWGIQEMGKRNIRFLYPKRDIKLTHIFTQFRAKYVFIPIPFSGSHFLSGKNGGEKLSGLRGETILAFQTCRCGKQEMIDRTKPLASSPRL